MRITIKTAFHLEKCSFLYRFLLTSKHYLGLQTLIIKINGRLCALCSERAFFRYLQGRSDTCLGLQTSISIVYTYTLCRRFQIHAIWVPRFSLSRRPNERNTSCSFILAGRFVSKVRTNSENTSFCGKWERYLMI